ncbi:RagB/SusD family nutrient uptake outer membrane protein [Niabella insulamsoli]|uniref:RagB/SusD family nutrient uptake outer membrane protein n=1 Tax=Niabella insulamsoli TaxID=3144874 RepID=UPI0031FC5194
MKRILRTAIYKRPGVIRGNAFFCLALIICGSLFSCKKFLDIVPDNVSTLDNAFKLRNEAEKYLFTCYSYLPNSGNLLFNPASLSGDEIWLPQNDQSLWNASFRVAQEQQNRSDPYVNVWRGTRSGGGSGDSWPIWSGIRHCNIFLENLRNPARVPDMTAEEKLRWIGEVEFLKAYYHFYLMRMYGPIPLIKENVPLESTSDDLGVNRMPLDSCVNYISSLLDSAVTKLPTKIFDENNELGRVTQPVALAMKAKLLLLAASPLFNGNPDYANFTDHEGVLLFNPTYDPGKWEKARDAALAAINSAHENGFSLYKYELDLYGLSDVTKTQLSIRNAVTERFNREHIWALSNSYFGNSAGCIPPLTRSDNGLRDNFRGYFAPTMKIAKMFYSKNGVPIEEDKTLDFSDYTTTRTATEAEKFNIEQGYVSARLNFDREPRFYADLGFDGSVWYMKSSSSGNDQNTYYVSSKNTQKAGFGHYLYYSQTGYFIKKLVSWESTVQSSSAPVFKNYPWPEIRLADLYLMYAEALNEAEPASATAITYLDMVRERAGLEGVVASWSQFSKNPTKYTSQAGLRAIIQRERLIELAFEGQRFWDLRRWKLAASELNSDIKGWNIVGKSAADYNIETIIHDQHFITPRDYLWPIGNYDTRRNAKLVENPGW